MPESVYERVKKRAYEIWEAEGRPWGRDSVHWERAHQEITDENEAAPLIRVGSVESSNGNGAVADAPVKAVAKRKPKKIAG